MANIKISELPEANIVQNDDLLTIIQEGTNKKVTKEILLQEVNSDISDIQSEQITQNADIQENETKIQELEQEIQSLKEASYKVTGTGTDITLNNTSNNKFLQLDVKGNTEQTQLTGKNILDGANPTGANYANATLNNNVLKISSTATHTTPFVRYEFNATEGEIYRLNAIIKNTNGQIVFQKYSSSWESVFELTRNYIDGTSISSISYTVPSSVTMVRFLIYANNNVPSSASESNYENVIVTKDNANMTYEPYCGGTQSPNPEFPQPIYNVTGDVNIRIQNKNLAVSEFQDKISFSGSGNNRTVVTSGYKLSQIIKVKPNTTYTVYGDYNSLSDKRIRIFLFDEYPNTGTVSTQYLFSDVSTAYTFTTGTTITYIALYGAVSTPTDVILPNLQLEENSTATSYVAHQEQNLPFTLENNNLFDKNKVTYGYYLNTQGTLDSANNCCVSDYINIQEGKSYYISRRGTNRAKFYNENKQPLTSKFDVLDAENTFTAPTNAKYIRISINYYNISLDTFIICEGTSGANCITQRLYEDDDLADDGIHHVRKQKVFTGEETLYKSGYTTSTAFVCYMILADVKNNGNEGKCNIGFVDNVTRINNYLNGIFYNTSGTTVFLKIQNSSIPNWDDTLSDTEKVNLVKALLAQLYTDGTPVILEYELETEEIEPYNETQASQYNAIKEAMSYYGQTHISSTSDEASAKIDATAIGDLNLVIS